MNSVAVESPAAYSAAFPAGYIPRPGAGLLARARGTAIGRAVVGSIIVHGLLIAFVPGFRSMLPQLPLPERIDVMLKPRAEPAPAPVEAPKPQVRLQRGKLVSAAEWQRLRDLGDQLLAVKPPSANRSLQAQDRFAAAAKDQGSKRRTVLQSLHKQLIDLGVEAGDRLKQLADANTRLAPLALSTTDSHKVLGDLLTLWPDEPSDPLRGVVQQSEEIRNALAELNVNARNNLRAGLNHPTLGVEVSDHLGALDLRLRSAEAEQPLTQGLDLHVEPQGAKAGPAPARTALFILYFLFVFKYNFGFF